MRGYFKRLALHGIRLYRRYVSPHKGFRCAYAAHTGRHSCSDFGYRAIDKHGVWVGMRLLRRQLQRCAWQHRQALLTHGRTKPRPMPPLAQRGMLDCDCGLPDWNCWPDSVNPLALLDYVDCLPDACGNGSEQEAKRRQAREARKRRPYWR